MSVCWKNRLIRKVKLVIIVTILLLLTGCTTPNEIEPIIRGVRGTGSMRPLFEKSAYPDIEIETEPLGENDSIRIGRIYVYTKNITIQNETTYTNNITAQNETIIENKTETLYVGHLLVGIYNISGEIVFVFRGINNIYVDNPVNRSQIIEEVVGIDLK